MTLHKAYLLGHKRVRHPSWPPGVSAVVVCGKQGDKPVVALRTLSGFPYPVPVHSDAWEPCP